MAHPTNPPRQLTNQVKLNNGGSVNDDDQHQAIQLTYNAVTDQTSTSHTFNNDQFNVRIKRHPELQPYIPSDRDRLGSAHMSSINNHNSSSTSGSRSVYQARKPQSKLDNRFHDDQLPGVVTKQKKCVSMTRLDQLAQPKKVFTKDSIRQATSNSNSIVQQSRILLRSKQTTTTQKKDSQQPPVKSKLSNILTKAKPPLNLTQQSTPKPPRVEKPQSLQSSEDEEKRNAQSIVRKLSSDAVTPKPNIMNQTFDTCRKDLQHGIGVAGSLWDELNGPSSPQSNASVTKNEQNSSRNTVLDRVETADQTQNESVSDYLITDASKQSIRDSSSLADQLSEMSVNGINFMSANSSLWQESENSPNGIGQPKSMKSLCNDLEAELIAEGIVKPDLSKAGSEQQSATSLDASSKLLESSRCSKDDDSRIMKIEEELRERALREENDRLRRQRVVDSILSKFPPASGQIKD